MAVRNAAPARAGAQDLSSEVESVLGIGDGEVRVTLSPVAAYGGRAAGSFAGVLLSDRIIRSVTRTRHASRTAPRKGLC
jgi:hypothetical protein